MRQFVSLLAALLLTSGHLSADEKAIKSRITSVSLFKNGLAIVKREVCVPGPGDFRLHDVPEPVHGTYWVESPISVESVVQTREVEVAAEPTGVNLQEELAGKKVTVYFRNDKLIPLTGTVVPRSQRPAQESTTPAWESSLASLPMTPITGRFLILQTARGMAYVEPGDVAYFEADGAAATVKRRKAVLLIKVSSEVKEPATVTITYLAHGLAWAPSYRIDTTNAKRLTLEQGAVIKNEMADLAGAEVSLITGFPSVQFAHVLSPLAIHTSWATFFQQLAQRPQASHAALSNTIVTQNAATSGEGGQVPLFTFIPGHEGVDLYYHSIGKRSLARGAALALTTSKGQTDYERIIDWRIADQRDAFGNPTARFGDMAETDDDVPWDALRFKNPLPFPLTTGPALVLSQGRFSGQQMMNWVDAGEETTIKITKALSVRTRSVEHEQQTGTGTSDREIVNIGGRRFRRTTVEGELFVHNHRSESVKLLIRRRFSGDLIQATGAPKATLLEEGVYSVNKRNELIWTVTLKPGEEKALPYRYAVLVSF